MTSGTEPPNLSSFGVIYTPDTVETTPPSLDIFHSHRIKFVRLQWVDYTNTVRFFLTPTLHFQKMLTSQRPGTGVGKCTLGLIFLTLAPGFSSNGEYLLVPDLTSLRIAPYARHHAVVMCYLQEKFPSPEHGLVVPIDPRTLLKRIIEYVGSTFSLCIFTDPSHISVRPPRKRESLFSLVSRLSLFYSGRPGHDLLRSITPSGRLLESYRLVGSRPPFWKKFQMSCKKRALKCNWYMQNPLPVRSESAFLRIMTPSIAECQCR